MDTDLVPGRLPLATQFLAAPVRSHLRAVNRFAASLAVDPPARDAEDRFDRLESGLAALAAGRRPDLPVLGGLLDIVEAYALPVRVLYAMVAAARSEWGTMSYASFAQLAACCHRSADPRGELALLVLGQATEERVALCGFIGAGTRLLGHVLTATVDWRAGRRYLPMDELDRFGVAGRNVSGRRAALLGLQAERARALLECGAPVVATLRGRQRLAVAAHLARCRAILAALERGGYRVPQWQRPSGAAVLGQWVRAVVRSAG
jgi:phytoene/squalene synthetase